MNEERLFELIKKIVPDLKKRHPLSYRDAYSPEYDLTIEFKSRRTHYDFILIEKFKWDKLNEYPRVRYINSTPIGIYSFNLKKIEEPEWMEHLMPKQTDFEDTMKVQKLVGFLPISLAINITFLTKL